METVAPDLKPVFAGICACNTGFFAFQGLTVPGGYAAAGTCRALNCEAI